MSKYLIITASLIKANLIWDHNCRFGQYKAFSFDPASSCAGCSDEDEVTVINVPLLTIVDKIKGTRNSNRVKSANFV